MLDTPRLNLYVNNPDSNTLGPSNELPSHSNCKCYFLTAIVTKAPANGQGILHSIPLKTPPLPTNPEEGPAVLVSVVQ
jgi:hypothetical protein